jgi:hypothetical protein
MLVNVLACCGFGGHIRGAQSRLARLSTSVAQHTAVEPVQRGSWRLSRAGAATAAAAKARMMENCILKDVVLVWCLEGGSVEIVCCRVEEMLGG